MSDRELLEKAARAAGLFLPKKNTQFCGIDERGIYLDESQDGTRPVYWNPLTDDGDALRLAVKLNLRVHTHNFSDFPKAAAFRPSLHDPFVGFAEEASGHDPYAATRRAIVRAAAAIGGEE